MKRFICYFFTLLVTINSSIYSEEGLQKIKCTLRPIPRHNSTAEDQSILPHISIKDSTSLNWSGYVAATNLHTPASNSVTSVTGTWTVPKIVKSQSSHTYSSLWVGIDGYSDETVEQIGTEQDWVGRGQENYAWFEMYPLGAYEIVNFPVNAGDSITASVNYLGRGIFKMTITNNTRRVTYTVPTQYTISQFAQRSSAEWIMEAPYLNGVLPLADFGHSAFTNCLATIDGITGGINNSHWQYDPISMETVNSMIKSLVSSLSPNGEAFSVTWFQE